MILSLMIAGCSKNDPVEPEKVLPGMQGQTLPRTLIIYMAGQNSLHEFVQFDSLEIAQGLSNIGVNHRVVVFIDDTKSSRLCVGMREQPLQTVKKYPEDLCSTDSTTMDFVLRDIISLYPAEHYGIVFWSHADGWLPSKQTTSKTAPRRSFGIDTGKNPPSSNNGVSMDLTTLANVLSHLPHTDFIFFDACFMQCIEVAYQLRNVTDYIIGSPAEIPGSGAPYQNILQPMCQVPTHVEDVVNGYVDYYLNGSGRTEYRGAEISAIRTSELETLALVSAPYLKRIFANRTTPDCTDVQKYNYRKTSSSFTEFYDFKNLMYNKLSADEYEQWSKAYDSAVPFAPLTPVWYSAYLISNSHFCSITDLEHTGGTSIFVPSEVYADRGWGDAYHNYDWYSATDMKSTGW